MAIQSKLFDENSTKYHIYFDQVISYRPNLKMIYEAIKHLDYSHFMNFRDEFMRHYESISGEIKTADAKQKYWERVIKDLEIEFDYKKPQSTTKAAEAMRKLRALRGY